MKSERYQGNGGGVERSCAWILYREQGRCGTKENIMRTVIKTVTCPILKQPYDTALKYTFVVYFDGEI